MCVCEAFYPSIICSGHKQTEGFMSDCFFILEWNHLNCHIVCVSMPVTIKIVMIDIITAINVATFLFVCLTDVNRKYRYKIYNLIVIFD